MSIDLIKINEIFETIQGEGTRTGTPSIFLRLQGCDVGCNFCDTKYTWFLNSSKIKNINTILNKVEDNDYYARIQNLDLQQLIINKFKSKNIVFTGGEPCLYNLYDLTKSFEDINYQTQIETSGTEIIKCHNNTWVTVSPKINMKGGKLLEEQAINRANEIKFPIGKQKDIAKLKQFIKDYNIYNKVIFLQPLSQSKKATELCIQECYINNWRLSIQTHKYIGLR